MASPQSTSGDVTPKAAHAPALLVPPTADLFGGNPRQSTPPPMASPLPRTPKPQRFLSPPRTPIAKLSASFGGGGGGGDGDDNDNDGCGDGYGAIDVSMLHAGMAITRPSSSCSTYSCSSDSSVDSNTTYNSTAGGSCTSIEDEEGGYYDTPQGKAPEPDGYILSVASDRQLIPQPEGKSKGKGQQAQQAQRSGRARKTKWTRAMDAHLWKTYMLYQQDPKITPFFVLPGAVPPLGVCYKVARETKRSWKEARLNAPAPKPPLLLLPPHQQQPPPVRPRQRAVQPVSESSNRADSLRKATPFAWPASEASTRRRLRELCRENYGALSRNPYHNHHQQRRAHAHGPAGPSSAADINSRPPTVSPSPLQSSAIKTAATRDPFSTTRNMALSLTTSTATSMRPCGALASLAAGRDIHSSCTLPPRPFGGIAERIESAAATTTASATVTSLRTQQSVVATGSLGLGVELSATYRSRHSRTLSLDSTAPSLLPPLELKSSRSPYGTWPRRLKRAELNDDDDGESTTPLPPRSRPRRGTLVDLFGDEQSASTVSAAAAAATANITAAATTVSTTTTTTTTATTAIAPAPKSRARARGYTISAGTNPLGTRRRSGRTGAAAPLLTVTGPVSYDSPSAQDSCSSPISRRERFEKVDAGSDLPRRLGSPFAERERERD